MKKIQVTWYQTETLSAVIRLANAIEMYNRGLMGGFPGIEEDYERLPADATAEQVAAALKGFSDLGNQLADYDNVTTLREDGPYRVVTEIEVVSPAAPLATKGRRPK